MEKKLKNLGLNSYEVKIWTALTNAEKIKVCLIGKYFAHNILKIPNTDGLDISQLSNELAIPSTTLSKPLGNMVKERKITKVGGKYRIIYYEIENILNELNLKYKTNNQ